ncbi:ABC transporter substrate-binding protein [Leucobacter sp. USHLN153]|uniref:ABC transporter substrate-binding protein n=1 Tax=Leucobacter sp. USHLN153 TaxID=3081268 RepID=UPI0030194260
MTSRFNRGRSLLALAALSSLLLAGCAQSAASGSDDSASAEPIKVGAVSSITGPAPFPEVPGAAQAVFDRVNAAGGINGRQIEYISEDDGADPAQASQAARRLVDEEGVVAFAGAASLVECSANAALYAKSGVVSLSGTGVEPACFESENIAPVNNGTIQGYASLLYFASETLEDERVCPVILNSAGLTEPYLELIDKWEKDTGSKAPHVDTSVTLGDDPTPAVLAVRDAKCDAVVFNANEPVAVAFMNTVKQQGLLDAADWLTLTSAYSESVLDTLKKQDTLGMYANSEFLPFTSDDPELDDWRETLTDADVPLTSLSEGGYVSAEILVSVLEGIEGDITRESVTQAFRELDEIEHPLMGMPFTFGEAKAHNPNRASQMVQATADGWETVGDWVRVP